MHKLCLAEGTTSLDNPDLAVFLDMQQIDTSNLSETNITNANNNIVAQDLLSGGPETKMLLLEDEVRKVSVAMQAEVSSSRGSQSAEERCLLMSNTLQSLTTGVVRCDACMS